MCAKRVSATRVWCFASEVGLFRSLFRVKHLSAFHLKSKVKKKRFDLNLIFKIYVLELLRPQPSLLTELGTQSIIYKGGGGIIAACTVLES